MKQKKGGWSLRHPEGGHYKFWGSFNTGTCSLTILKGEGGGLHPTSGQIPPTSGTIVFEN